MDLNVKTSMDFIELIKKINSDITYGYPLEKILHNVIEIIYHNIKSKSVAVLLTDPSTEYLKVRSSIGLSQMFMNHFQRLNGTGIIAKMLRGGESIMANNVLPGTGEYDDLKLEIDFTSALSTRIYSHAKIYGYLICHRTSDEPFSREELSFVEMMAQFISIALYQCKLTTENIELTEIDKDTGILKFNAFSARLYREFERAKKKNENISIILIDIDRFKDFHRSFGDQVAHQLVENLITVTKSYISGLDLIAKYGVDQVTVALFDKDDKDACEISEKIKSDMYNLDFNRSHNPVSIGVLCCRPEEYCDINRIYDKLGICILRAHYKDGNTIINWNE